MSKKLEEILKKNKEFEQQSPYNFCDRWCERCFYEKQIRCKLYQDELEQKMICIAHGKKSDDPEITEAVMKRQLEEIEEKLGKAMDKYGIDLDNPDMDEDWLSEEDAVELEDLPPEIQEHILFVENNNLQKTAEQYRKKTHEFLERNFYGNNSVNSKFKENFQTIAWYHSLVSVKINRALAGLHEPMTKGDLALYDAVAQLQICKKAIGESIKAFNNIKPHYPKYKRFFLEAFALLNNISSQITLIENWI
ncbi:MAG: hypothetical protein ABIG64_10280 [Candidatus Omnitrophota bacterium]